MVGKVHPLLVGEPHDLYRLCAHVQRAVPARLSQSAGTDLAQWRTAAVPSTRLWLQRIPAAVEYAGIFCDQGGDGDRKSTRLNSSHRCISYAVFCLKKKNNKEVSPTYKVVYRQCKVWVT